MIFPIALSVLFGAVAAAGNTPSNPESYAPRYVDCPENIQLVRQPHQISPAETEWVHGRKAVVADSITSYLARLNLTGFDLDDYAARIHRNPDYNVPVIAWATSGGGWRSGFTGIGGLQAIDERTPGSKEAKVGGLFQSLTYLAGLSGGSWPTTSTALSDYIPIHENAKEWHVDINRFTVTGFSEYAAPTSSYFETIAEKFQAGFNISAADLMGRGFAYEFVPGVNRTLSSIAEQPGFKSFAGPMPILATSSVNRSSESVEGLYVPDYFAPWYEWNPFEFGSWEFGFVPTKYVGTIADGNNTAEKCVENLDDAGFVMASVAAAYNFWWLGAISNGTLGQFSKREEGMLGKETLETINEVFAKYFNLTLAQIANPSIPNPFNGGKENITFADSSEAGQSDPFTPLIQPERRVDFM